jgi:prepilin-type N-terminal cleavage/methylation domain-containing protein
MKSAKSDLLGGKLEQGKRAAGVVVPSPAVPAVPEGTNDFGGAPKSIRGARMLPFPSASRKVGFTLIEVLLGLALFGILTGGIFAVQHGAMQVSQSLTERQSKTMRMHSFCELLRRNFESLPGNAKLVLTPTGGGNSGLSEIAFTQFPLAFTWPGVPAGSESVLFRVARSESGVGLGATLIYLDKEQTADYEANKLDDRKILARLNLMEGIMSLDWRFYNDATQTWELEWLRTQSARPSMVEMTLTYLDGQDPVRLYFWVPQMANPQTFTQGGAADGGAGGPPGGGPGAGGPPGGGPPPGASGPGGGGRGPGGGGGGGRGPGAGGGGGGGRGPGGGGAAPPRGGGGGAAGGGGRGR